MKKYLLLISIILISMVKIQAQELEIQAYAQETIIGLQKGYSVKMVNKKGLKFGMFYQSSQNFSFSEGESNYPFVGSEISFPMASCGKVKLVANLKGGLVNYQFLALVPELETTYQLKDYIALGMGSSLRGGHAAISFKVIFQPFNQGKLK